MKRTLAIASSVCAAAICGACSLASAQEKSACEVRITSPGNDGQVTHFTPVVGEITLEAAAIGDNVVWVVIHPDDDFYWVERPATARQGSWRAQTRFGIPATPSGFHFEAQAVVAPTISIAEGDRLSGFPGGACKSDVVNVTLQ